MWSAGNQPGSPSFTCQPATGLADHPMDSHIKGECQMTRSLHLELTTTQPDNKRVCTHCHQASHTPSQPLPTLLAFTSPCQTKSEALADTQTCCHWTNCLCTASAPGCQKRGQRNDCRDSKKPPLPLLSLPFRELAGEWMNNTDGHETPAIVVQGIRAVCNGNCPSL